MVTRKPFPSDVNAILVGQPMKILVCYTTAIIECQCDAKTVLPLHGVMKVATCPACQKQFAIAKSGAVEIGVVAVPEIAGASA